MEPWPESPRSLLEARYKAMVGGNIDFLLESHHPETRERVDRKALEVWSLQSKWDGIQFDKEETDGDKAYIHFAVRFEQDFKIMTQREKAEFRRSENRWYYFDSEFLKPETIIKGQQPGRNDPCLCGSGKKFKKCCGLKG